MTKLERLLMDEGYYSVTLLPTGEYCALMVMAFTTGLFVGLDEINYRTRYCYPTFIDAMEAIEQWRGIGDPPGPWIKQKPENRLNPKL